MCYVHTNCIQVWIKCHVFLSQVKVVCCDKGRMVTEFKVSPEHLNQRGSLHGGFIAHLVDAVSTYALTANETVDTRGVSIELSIRYFLLVSMLKDKTSKRLAPYIVDILKTHIKRFDASFLIHCISLEYPPSHCPSHHLLLGCLQIKREQVFHSHARFTLSSDFFTFHQVLSQPHT